VIRQPLQLQGDTPQRVGAGGRFGPGQRLNRLRVGECVRDRRVAGGGLDHVHRTLVRAGNERPLDAPVLIAEGDLEVEDALAVALEPEVSGLDDAGVHGADRHLVDFVAFDAEEVGHARQRAGEDGMTGAP